MRDLARCPKENGLTINDRSGFVPSEGPAVECNEPTTTETTEGKPDESYDKDEEGSNDANQGDINSNVDPGMVEDFECTNNNSIPDSVQHLNNGSISRKTSDGFRVESRNDVAPRRSNRGNKGVPPSTFGDWIE